MAKVKKSEENIVKASESVQGEMVSITQALSKCSILAERINRIYNDSELALSDYVVNGKLQNHPTKTKEEFLQEVKSKIQSAQDLVDRLYRMKTRIAYLNATTELKVLGKTYSPYSLMLLLNNNQFEKPNFINMLKTRHVAVKQKYDKKVEEAEQRALSMVAGGMGSQSSLSDIKANLKSGTASMPILNAYKEFLNNNMPELIEFDSDAMKYVENSIQNYEDFVNEARTALDEYNILTKVCID